MNYSVNEITVEAVKTYASPKNVRRAVEKLFPHEPTDRSKILRYVIMTNDEGRFFPVFIGAEAISAGVHFHFNVLG